MSAKASKKTGRLKRRSDFLRLQSQGRKWVAPHVIVQCLENDAGTVRTGYTATKKLGGAVVRNRIKRRLRAAACEAIKTVAVNCDLVLIGRRETAACPYRKLVSDLLWCLKRLNARGAAS